jgi:hypothetical protein
MGEFSRDAKATQAQRMEVIRLATEGLSIRRIATQVFDDPRFRGRVERILCTDRRAAEKAAAPVAADPLLDALDLEQLGVTGFYRLMLERHMAVLAAREKPPTARELKILMDVQLRLISMEGLERVRELTRERS